MVIYATWESSTDREDFDLLQIKWSLLLISSLIETNINEKKKLTNDQTMDLHSFILLEKFFLS